MENTMREILFRGKRIEDGEWIYGGYSHCANDNTVFITVMGKDKISYMGCHQQIQPETIGQYTGLTDKNGKKIFEGDIITDIEKIAYVIRYDHELVAYTAKQLGGGLNGQCFLFLLNGIEIIGNIHDNHALLEVENET